jgi:hypothetical protein
MTALWPSPDPAFMDGALAAVDPFRSFSFFLFCRHYQHSIPADVSKHPVKLREVNFWFGYKGHQPGDEIQRFE